MEFLARIIHKLSLQLLARNYFYHCNLCHAELVKYKADDVVVFRCPNFLDDMGIILLERDAQGKKRTYDFLEVKKDDLK